MKVVTSSVQVGAELLQLAAGERLQVGLQVALDSILFWLSHSIRSNFDES